MLESRDVCWVCWGVSVCLCVCLSMCVYRHTHKGESQLLEGLPQGQAFIVTLLEFPLGRCGTLLFTAHLPCIYKPFRGSGDIITVHTGFS